VLLTLETIAMTHLTFIKLLLLYSVASTAISAARVPHYFRAPHQPDHRTMGVCYSPHTELPLLASTSQSPSPVIATLPSHLLYISASSIPNAGQGVFALVPLQPGAYFGPYAGMRTRNPTANTRRSGNSWMLHDGEWIDASDDRWANWMVKVNSWVG